MYYLINLINSNLNLQSIINDKLSKYTRNKIVYSFINKWFFSLKLDLLFHLYIYQNFSQRNNIISAKYYPENVSFETFMVL